MNLVFRDRAGETRSFSLAGRPKVTLGREATRDMVIAEALVSRLHATIENVQGSYFLRDARSANGTFLNGLRLSGASAIMLREGDVIEIGSTSFVFSATATLGASAEKSDVVAEGQETTYPLGDLILDGLAAFKARNEAHQAAWDEALTRLLSEPGPRALEQLLARLVVQTRVDGAAVFVTTGAGGGLALQASCPGEHPGKRLAPIAERAFAARAGLLFCPRVAADSVPVVGEETIATPRVHTTAAAAFEVPGGDPRGLGVLAVERYLPRLDRADLALLAVMADRIARALSPAPTRELP